MTRDYSSEMRAACRAWLDRDDARVNGDLAQKIIAELDATDPDLLNGWMRLTLAHNLSTLLRSMDAADRHRGKVLAFATARENYEAGEASAFDAVYVVADDNLRKRVAAMTKADHLFVADGYDRTAKAARLEAAFHRAVAKRIGPDQTTADVMDEATYLRLRESLTARTA